MPRGLRLLIPFINLYHLSCPISPLSRSRTLYQTYINIPVNLVILQLSDVPLLCFQAQFLGMSFQYNFMEREILLPLNITVIGTERTSHCSTDMQWNILHGGYGIYGQYAHWSCVLLTSYINGNCMWYLANICLMLPISYTNSYLRKKSPLFLLLAGRDQNRTKRRLNCKTPETPSGQKKIVAIMREIMLAICFNSTTNNV